MYSTTNRYRNKHQKSIQFNNNNKKKTVQAI